MTIKDLCKESHKIALEKGFWEVYDNGSTKPRNMSEMLMLVVSELGEACEALRKGIRQLYKIKFRTTVNIWTNKLLKHEEINESIWKKDTFEDELADAIIRICDLAEANKIDLEWQIQKKLEYNKTRPHKHGKEF